jgi:myo-inositol-1(or 4)-monophosphatase
MNKESINLDEARKNIIDIVLKAGEIIKKSFDEDLVLYKKEGIDFTTQTDRNVDVFLRKEIGTLYPQTNFLTEETAPSDYSSMKEAENLWIIDPLDGTVNFSRKNTNFAISVALVDKGIPILGIIYLPLQNIVYSAQADKDRALVNDKAISVSSTSKIEEAVLACDWSWDVEKRKNVIKWLNSINSKVRQIKSMGSAASDLASLADGKIDAYVHSGIKPWDVAAAALIIEKAGGKITNPTGGSWNVFDSDIVATNGIMHSQIVKLLNDELQSDNN